LEEGLLDEQPIEETQQEDINTVQLCLFQIDNEQFAVDILQVQEIIKPAEITRIPATPKFLLGVINLRGIIIPIIEIKSFIGMDLTQENEEGEYLVVKDGNLILGITVVKVLNMVIVPEKNVTIFEEDHPLRVEKYILGQSIVYDKTIYLLDLHRLIRDTKAAI
jgi:purine-binding chemotaxis protein CheW